MSLQKFIAALESDDGADIIDFLETPLDAIEGEEWQERTAEMLAATLPAIIFASEEDGAEIGIDNIREQFDFGHLIRIARNPELPEELREGLIGYFEFIPGYDSTLFYEDGKGIPGEEFEVVLQQHDMLVKLFFDALGD